MVSNRRIGKESSETRKALLQAAGELMRDEGYAEVTSRKLAQKAGLKPQLVHYYFRTMGDLFAELFRQSSDYHLKQLDEAAVSAEPLVAVFEISCDPGSAALQLEFLALANHRKEMHALIAEFGAKLNQRKSEIIRNAANEAKLKASGATVDEIATIIESLARGLAFSGKFNAIRVANARDKVSNWLRTFSERGDT